MAEAETTITLRERRATETARLRSASDAVLSALRDYAHRNGGRFLVFGSAAQGSLRPGSDIDLIADFDDRGIVRAVDAAEELAAEHGIRVDIQPLATARPQFLEAVLPGAIVLE